MHHRQSNNPKRRIAPAERLRPDQRRDLRARLRYVGSANHKRHPADYPFHPPAAPRPHKSVCDDLRVIPWAEAGQVFQDGLARGLISEPGTDGLPKYVWAVDADGQAYEAKIGGNAEYHGYRLGEAHAAAMRKVVLAEWSKRDVR